MSIVSLLRVIQSAKQKLISHSSVGMESFNNEVFIDGFETCEELIKIHIERNPEVFNKDILLDEALRENVKLKSDLRAAKAIVEIGRPRIDQVTINLKKEYMENVAFNLECLCKKGEWTQIKQKVLFYAETLKKTAEKWDPEKVTLEQVGIKLEPKDQ